MHRLCRAANLPEAHLLLHQLAQAGIQAQVLNQYGQGALGDLPFLQVSPEIWLDDARDVERAQTIVRDYQHARPRSGARRCSVCGEDSPPEFELCWRCGKEFA